MSQRDSGYVRKERDAYETPEWVTMALVPHIPERVKTVWEPACGSGKMARVLDQHYRVEWSDIEFGEDFLDPKAHGQRIADAIITNPPYEHALAFIETALARAGYVAMLLRTDYDHAKTRQRLFLDKRFAKKVVLTKRIKWFEDSKGSPSFNHCWMIWDSDHKGPPTIAYGP